MRGRKDLADTIVDQRDVAYYYLDTFVCNLGKPKHIKNIYTRVKYKNITRY